MNKTYSQIIVTGIVISTDHNISNKDTVSPVIQLTTYDTETKTWLDNIYILFSDNSNARKFRMFNIGDILLLSGELIYYSGAGFLINPLNYVVLDSNKKDIPIDVQKSNLISSTGVLNHIFIKGNLLNLSKNIASISHDIVYPVKGNINQVSIQPVQFTNDLKKAVKDIVFVGKFTTDLDKLLPNKAILKGELYNVK